jgi:xylose isomerase
MRTTRPGDQLRHLANSKKIFMHMLDLVRSVDERKVEAFRAERDYEGLEMYILEHLLRK